MQWFTSVEGTANGAGWLIRVRARRGMFVLGVPYRICVSRRLRWSCVSLRVFANETRAAQGGLQGSHVLSLGMSI